jgi:hypothetical protein
MSRGEQQSKQTRWREEEPQPYHLLHMQTTGTLFRSMQREKYLKTSVTGITEGCRKYKEKTQQGVANLKEIVCNYCLVINIVRTCKS